MKEENIYNKRQDLINFAEAINVSDGDLGKIEKMVDLYLETHNNDNSPCNHEKTTKHLMSGIRYCNNPKCQKIVDIE